MSLATLSSNKGDTTLYLKGRVPFSAGFTLLELVLVMMLVAILLAITTPAVRGFLGNSRSRDAVNQIIAISQWARGQAASESKVFRLGFDAGGYRLTMQEGEHFTLVRSDFGRLFTLPQGTRVEIVPTRSAATPAQGQAGSVAFYPDGQTDAGIVRVTDAVGRVTLIACPSPAEAFRVVTPEEAAEL